MTFKEYFIKESPDIVWKDQETELSWSDTDARSFGWLNSIPGIEGKYFMRAKRAEVSHYDMVENLFDRMFNVLNDHEEEKTFPVDQIHKKLLRMIELSPFFLMPKYRDFVNEVTNSQKVMESFASYKMSEWLNKLAFDKKRNDTSMKAQLSYSIRTKVFNNAGRIWLRENVVSFWLTQNEVSKDLINQVLDYFSVPDNKKENFLIDAVNTQEIRKEQTSKKVLPTYKDFLNIKTNIQTNTKKQKEDIVRLMSQQHGVAGVQKAKYDGKKLPEVGAAKYAKQLPLDVRQKVQTSESIS